MFKMFILKIAIINIMKNDKTERELLEEIINLLKPISKLSTHYNNIIKDEIDKEKSISHLKYTRTAAGEMKKEADELNS